MTNKQHPAQFDWATELLDAQGHVTLSAKEAHEIGARLRSMGEKLKTYEDLDEAASDVQLLRMGYAAARLEIESLQARIKTMAEEHADELMVAHLDGRMRAAQPTGAILGEQAELRRLSDCCPELNLSNYGHDDVDELNGWAIEVSQCIDRALAAQPAPATPASRISLDFKQTTELLDMFGGKPGKITVAYGDGHTGHGLYAYYSDMLEEGSTYFGGSSDTAWPEEAPAAVAGPSDSEIDALVMDIGPTEGIRRDSRDLTMDKLRLLVRRALATWGHVKVAPAALGDAPTDAGPISRQWLTVVYRGVEAGDEVQQICTHPKVSAMSWSHAIHDSYAARAAHQKGETP